jgi:hypothetical protein
MHYPQVEGLGFLDFQTVIKPAPISEPSKSFVGRKGAKFTPIQWPRFVGTKTVGLYAGVRSH